MCLAQSPNWPGTLSKSNWNLEVLVFEERGKPEYPEKTLSERGREPFTYDAESGNRTRATLVVGECSHHCAIPVFLSHCDKCPLMIKENKTQTKSAKFSKLLR